MPKISVVIPTYNVQQYIVETLNSVLRQDAEFEILVLDDASTDNTLELVRSLNDPRIRIFALEHNQGRASNANRAFDLCSGEYIARIDHDDIAEPGRLRKQSEFLDANPEITVVGTQIRHFGEDTSTSAFPLDDANIKARFVLGSAYLANPSTMFRRDFVQRHGIRYDPNLDIVDDLGFWFDCMLHGARFANLPEVLTHYRIHQGMTSLNLKVVKLYEAKVRLYTRMLPAFYPRLTGHDVVNLCKLHAVPFDTNMSMDDVLALYRSAGVAISDIDLRWGASPAMLEGGIVGLTGHRMGLRDKQHARSEEERHLCNVALWDGINARGIPWKSYQS
ncbi:glycosyl transferase family 2 [Caballeronia temeraria]|uniref:Glycosyl transferase family 2 n=1 Tax=Caballeronia temeraria TaxID=1777137 RepID=A0A158D912_9BURK|nr:glycosyltransferase family 2 protein [Caballeronia temeraria]SAK91162.1 glycosyl transferase family 2 [Caballeronia temeraria]